MVSIDDDLFALTMSLLENESMNETIKDSSVTLNT